MTARDLLLLALLLTACAGPWGPPSDHGQLGPWHPPTTGCTRPAPAQPAPLPPHVCPRNDHSVSTVPLYLDTDIP